MVKFGPIRGQSSSVINDHGQTFRTQLNKHQLFKFSPVVCQHVKSKVQAQIDQESHIKIPKKLYFSHDHCHYHHDYLSLSPDQPTYTPCSAGHRPGQADIRI